MFNVSSIWALWFFSKIRYYTSFHEKSKCSYWADIESLLWKWPLGSICYFIKKFDWPNISANDPDPGSGWKNLSLKKYHFWLNDPVKGSLIFGIIWTEIFGTTDSIWSSMRFREWILEMYVFACTLCAFLALKKK